MASYLITVEELTDKGFIHENVDSKVLKTLIARVQRKEMKAVLGGALYRKLLELIEIEERDVDPGDMPEAYRTLMEDYVIPALIPMIEKRATVHLNYKMRNKAVGSGNDEFIRANNRQETADLQSDIDDDIADARNELVRFLRANRETYPEYDDRTNCVDVIPEDEEDSTSGGIDFVIGGPTSRRTCDND